MRRMTRRNMVAASAASIAIAHYQAFGWGSAAKDTKRKFTMDLSWGAIGVRANQLQAIKYLSLIHI